MANLQLCRHFVNTAARAMGGPHAPQDGEVDIMLYKDQFFSPSPSGACGLTARAVLRVWSSRPCRKGVESQALPAGLGFQTLPL